jgi:hypothetical protein
VDLLTSGTERRPRRRVAAAFGWRPPRRFVGVLLVVVLLVAASAVASVAPLRSRAERAEVTARLLASTVAVRDGGTDGVLRVAVANAGPRPVELTAVALEVPGVVPRGAGPLRRVIDPDRAVEVSLAFAVPDCAKTGPTGVLRVAVTAQGRPERELGLPLGAEVTAGCRLTSLPSVVALAVESVTGQARAANGAAGGELQVALHNHGGPVRLVSVTAEVPGVLFVSQTNPGDGRPTGVGERVRVPLPFLVPFCGGAVTSGRLLVTVRDASESLRQLAFPAEPQTAVDLTVVLTACAGGG